MQGWESCLNSQLRVRESGVPFFSLVPSAWKKNWKKRKKKTLTQPSRKRERADRGGRVLFPLSRVREREGPAAKRWEGEGLILLWSDGAAPRGRHG